MADPKKVLPGGDLGAPAEEARKDSTEYTQYVVKGAGGALKKFLGPTAKYENIADNLGIEKFDGTKHATAVRAGAIAVPRLTLTVKDDKDTASISVFCAIDKLASAFSNLVKDKCYGKEIVGVHLPRKRVLI